MGSEMCIRDSASTVPELFQKKIYRTLLSIAGILSVGYFGLVGIPLFF